MGIDSLLERYAPENRGVSFRFLDKLAERTRESGKISEAKRVKIITSFDEFAPDVVIASLNTYLSMDIPKAKCGKGKSENYVNGIMKNKQAEKLAKEGVRVGGNEGQAYAGGGKRAAGVDGDEGARLQQLAGSAGGGELECDF